MPATAHGLPTAVERRHAKSWMRTTGCAFHRDDPRYTLRRVWLTKEEEEGYYYGFANEGLWPLCHIAHTRPTFRAQDWQHYQNVNRKFTDAVLEEMGHVETRRSGAGLSLRVAAADDQGEASGCARGHLLAYPVAESGSIWHLSVAASIGGRVAGRRSDRVSHPVALQQFPANRGPRVESRVDWEHFSVTRQSHRTIVRPFPISVDLPDDAPVDSIRLIRRVLERSTLMHSLGRKRRSLASAWIVWITPREFMSAFRRSSDFWKSIPSTRGKFTFVQIGAPSRTHIKRYHDLMAEVEAEAERINWRFQSGKWKPIVFLKRHHSHEEIEQLLSRRGFCLVTSLHDGMNLVAKEFLAARHDEHGVLILSQFTGAARELRDALLVNPYDIDQTAEAIRAALEMEPEEKQMRVRNMRRQIREHNIYRWAGNLITELCELRLDAADRSPAETSQRRNRRVIGTLT